MLGPIDYAAVSFSGNNFDGSILAALSKAVESGARMENNSSAGLLLIDQLWVKELQKVLIDSGAELLDQGRVPRKMVVTAVEELNQKKVDSSKSPNIKGG